MKLKLFYYSLKKLQIPLIKRKDKRPYKLFDNGIEHEGNLFYESKTSCLSLLFINIAERDPKLFTEIDATGRLDT